MNKETRLAWRELMIREEIDWKKAEEVEDGLEIMMWTWIGISIMILGWTITFLIYMF